MTHNFKVFKPSYNNRSTDRAGIFVSIQKGSKLGKPQLCVSVKPQTVDKFRLRQGDRFFIGYDAEDGLLALIPDPLGYKLISPSKKDHAQHQLRITFPDELKGVLKEGDSIQLSNIEKHADGVIVGELF